MSEELEIGAEVRVFNQPGTFTVKSFNSDGSICLYGGTVTHQSFRDIRPELIRPAKKRRVAK